MPRRPDRITLLSWAAVLLAVGFVLAEAVALRDAGQRLRAQEAAEAAARAAARRDTLVAPAMPPAAAPPAR